MTLIDDDAAVAAADDKQPYFALCIYFAKY